MLGGRSAVGVAVVLGPARLDEGRDALDGLGRAFLCVGGALGGGERVVQGAQGVGGGGEGGCVGVLGGEEGVQGVGDVREEREEQGEQRGGEVGEGYGGRDGRRWDRHGCGWAVSCADGLW